MLGTSVVSGVVQHVLIYLLVIISHSSLTLLPPSLNAKNVTSLHQNINYDKEEVEQSDTKFKLSGAIQSE